MAIITKDGITGQGEDRDDEHFGWNCHNCKAEWEAEESDLVESDDKHHLYLCARFAKMRCPWCGITTHHPETELGRNERT